MEEKRRRRDNGKWRQRGSEIKWKTGAEIPAYRPRGGMKPS